MLTTPAHSLIVCLRWMLYVRVVLEVRVVLDVVRPPDARNTMTVRDLISISSYGHARRVRGLPALTAIFAYSAFQCASSLFL